MIATEILKDIRLSGLTITVIDGGLLKVEPKDKLTTTLRDQIREHKAALLAELSTRQTTPSLCRNCTRFEMVEIMGLNAPGCLYQAPGLYSDGWRRIPGNLDACIWH